MALFAPASTLVHHGSGRRPSGTVPVSFPVAAGSIDELDVDGRDLAAVLGPSSA